MKPAHHALLLMLASCGGGTSAPADAGLSVDAAGADAAGADGAVTDGAAGATDAATPALGLVGNLVDVACPTGVPPGSTCKKLRVAGCPGIESEPIGATLAFLMPSGAVRGTVTHFHGGGGEGFQTAGANEYRMDGLRQVFVSWDSDWEQTLSHGIKTAACRPATVLRWIFDQPGLHAGSRTQAFCAEGFSGGSAQLGYALAHYGMADILDYVNELSGPPFERLDLGCDGDAPATATVCGARVTMALPAKVGDWENVASPLTCGARNVPAAELARWQADSIGTGGVYDYPRTRVEFFDCTNNATAVTGMAQLYYDQIVQAEGGTSSVAFHCYSQADQCMGEGLGNGAAVAIQAMRDGCVPRHQ